MLALLSEVTSGLCRMPGTTIEKLRPTIPSTKQDTAASQFLRVLAEAGQFGAHKTGFGFRHPSLSRRHWIGRSYPSISIYYPGYLRLHRIQRIESHLVAFRFRFSFLNSILPQATTKFLATHPRFSHRMSRYSAYWQLRSRVVFRRSWSSRLHWARVEENAHEERIQPNAQLSDGGTNHAADDTWADEML